MAAGRLARWDAWEEVWQAVGAANGDVNALVMVGGRLLAGGAMSVVDGVMVNGVAIYAPRPGGYAGTWTPLTPGGVFVPGGGGGAVLAVAYAGGCLYLGGSFSGVADAAGVPARVARACVGGKGAFGPLEGLAADAPGGTVYAIAAAAPPRDTERLAGREWADCAAIARAATAAATATTAAASGNVTTAAAGREVNQTAAAVPGGTTLLLAP